jgi:hypothetical protein
MCNVQCAMCNVQCAMCNVQCAMCNVQCAMCHVYGYVLRLFIGNQRHKSDNQVLHKTRELAPSIPIGAKRPPQKRGNTYFPEAKPKGAG